MHFAFTEEQEELRTTARQFLAECADSEALRRAMESPEGHDPALWKRIGSELGWPAMIVPEEHGGLGLGFVELVALMEVMGESLLCAPFFSSVCLGANALLVAGSEAQKQAQLPALAEGRRLATLACAESTGGWDPAQIETSFAREGDEFVLRGEKNFVPDGAKAELMIVAARDAAGEGLGLFLVPAETTGISRQAHVTLDQTRRQASILLDGVRVPADAALGEPGRAGPALQRILDRAAVALAAEQVGAAQRCLDMSVAYAKERVQFGRPIGSFQAIQHKCADMMVAVEAARSAAYYAGCAAAEDGDGEELSLVASMAKATASDAFFRCAADAIQIHGGVGFTWEYDVQLYFKRAQSSEQLLGDPAYHRERVAQRIGL